MYQKRIFLFTLLLFCTACFSQPVNILSDSSRQRLRNFSVLPDRNYSFQQVLTDSNLVFIPTQRLEPGESRVYWIKLVIDNPSQYSGRYSIFHQPFIDNTVYCYDQDAKRWIETRTGVLAPVRTRRYGISTCMLQGGIRNTIYIRADIKALGRLTHFVKAGFVLEKETITRQQELQSWIFCIAVILVVLMFLVYNAIIFFSIRDHAYLYYLLIQAGGIFYIAANFQCFHYLIPWQGFSSWVSPGGSIYYFHLNLFIQRLATITILTGYVQLTRNYLQTRTHLPGLDQLLKWLIIVFAAFELVHNTISFGGIKYLDVYVNLYSNIGIAAIILGILVTAVAAKLRRVYAAGYFLWANLATLALMMCLAVYYIFAPDGSRNIWLPCACIVMQALMFAIALVARLRLVRETLANRQSEAAQLKTDIEQLVAKQAGLAAEHEQIQAHIQHEKNRNETLEQQLGANQRELASAALYITQKNELLARLRSQVRELSQLLPRGNKALKDIEASLQQNQFLNNDWEKFKLHFENVHPRFFEELRSKYPRLTQNEIRLCAYFHMNLATKEIAGLLNIDPASVRRAKTRLNKKMNGALARNAA